MKPRIVVGIVIVIGALIYLIAGGLQETAVYYVTVSELFERSDLEQTRGLRISGTVVSESIVWKESEQCIRFAMEESGDTLHVVYRNIPPDQLADGQQVVVEGTWRKESGEFQAGKILLKCPSKYEIKKERAADNSDPI
ncbi:cytochrome c maturation protein CcmE [candidate division KSB1 bacterium]|nr:cytochrome c maturation protein CcmE [candidate division KSB1 bacterium]